MKPLRALLGIVVLVAGLLLVTPPANASIAAEACRDVAVGRICIQWVDSSPDFTRAQFFNTTGVQRGGQLGVREGNNTIWCGSVKVAPGGQTACTAAFYNGDWYGVWKSNAGDTYYTFVQHWSVVGTRTS